MDPSIYSIPEDIQTSIDIDSAGLYTASEAALAAGTATEPPEPAPSGTPTATEIAPDPAETTLGFPGTFDPYSSLEEKVGEDEDLSDWEDVGTFAVNNATPTLNEGQASVTVSTNPTRTSVGTVSTRAPAATTTGSARNGSANSFHTTNTGRLVFALLAIVVSVELF